MSWMKKRLKNFTVMPAPMHVMKSAVARMNGTCRPRSGPNFRARSGFCGHENETAPGDSIAGDWVAEGTEAATGGSWKKRQGMQLIGMNNDPTITTAFIWCGCQLSPMISSPMADSIGPIAVPTVVKIVLVVKTPDLLPAGTLSAKIASEVLPDISMKTPSNTRDAKRKRTTSVIQATIASIQESTAKTVDCFKSLDRDCCSRSTSKPTGIAKNKLDKPEILSVMPTNELRWCFGTNVGPTAAPPPR
mmetsp:Transcript_88181/g.175096  ORF Transcript_88181/g.175096 Transcript_88181/m.175096 type:complete len:247 (+) Transcript_88181:620-1360(+)